jgi:sigma-E factor negative regulatory protein RseB
MKRILFFILCVALSWTWNAAAESPRDWLERMDNANGKYNFQGTLVHMCDGTMDIVRIVHRVDDGQVTERITSKASGGRQVIRNADEVMCILPDQKKVMVERRGSESSPIGTQIANFPSFSNISELHYEVMMLSPDRVAEHDTVVLAIRPTDEYRYGYRLWLDQRTALPLKFELVDTKGNGLEQGVFTDIQFSESISARDVEPTIATDEFEWQRSDTVNASMSDVVEGSSASSAAPKWRATRLPPGFKLAFAEVKFIDGDSVPMEQLVYSDGLATISVFIEASGEDDPEMDGMSNIGATHAFSITKNGYLITAMGGVPPDTARMVAMSVASH